MPIIVWSMLAVFFPWRQAGFIPDSALPPTKARPRTQFPAPPLAAGPAPQVITMHVVTQKHAAGSGQLTGKITVISNDGCVIKQQSATVLIEHN